MPETLPPTVHERLARCNERIFVDGLVTGALAELRVDGAVFSAIAGSGQHTFTVPPLNAGAEVRARQDTGAGFTPFSASVFVEDAFVPPEAAPTLPEEIGACSQCVLVSHATPGAQIEIFVQNKLVGEGFANRHGAVCQRIDLRELRGERGAILTARQVVCGAEGPFTGRELVSLPSLPKPEIGEPIFSCQNRVPVSNARAGAVLSFATDGGDDLGSLCSCWKAVNVGVIRPLVVGELVRTMCLYNADPCTETGVWSNWRRVEAPDERIKPEIREVLVEGDQVIRVANQISGATLTIQIAPAAGQAATEFGPRPASVEEEISLAAKLTAGNEVVVIQALCGVRVASDSVIVQPLPPEIFAPVVIDSMFACGQAVQVSNLHPGAFVRVFMDDVPRGQGWSGLQNSLTVPVQQLVAGRKITARQWLGGTASPISDGVLVRDIEELPRPRILGPVAEGDREIWVSGVTPGARVVIRSGGLLEVPKTIIGEVDAAEPILRVPVGPIVGTQPFLTVVPQVRLCDRLVSGPDEHVIMSPCAIPTTEEALEATLDFGDFDLPANAGGFTMKLRGQLYAPKQPLGGRMPLVIIAHGWHTGVDTMGQEVESFKGYAYLAHHLVRWGMLVFSVDLQPVKDHFVSASDAATSQDARAEVIMRVITLLLGHSITTRFIDPNRIGLVGHSMGGEAVAYTHFLNQTQNRGLGIQGAVSIAPTNWLNTMILPRGNYMQLFGSIDQLVGFLPSGDTPLAAGGMRIYDRAERGKTFFWLHGLRHNPFNSLWVAAGDFGEVEYADMALSEGEHQRVAKCLINAFFQDVLMGRSEYAGYMEGTVLPQSLRHLEIHTSHSKEPREVLDNFGDLDDQAGIPAEGILEKTVNSRSETALGSGTTLVEWEDERHSTITNSPHVTAGVRLSWQGPDAQYRSETGGLATVANDVVSLRLAQFYEDAGLNPGALPSDAFVTVSDGSESATVRLGAVAQIPYPDASHTVLSMMRTVRIPFDAFRAVNQSLNLGDVRAVELSFNAKPMGHILGDDFEIGA